MQTHARDHRAQKKWLAALKGFISQKATEASKRVFALNVRGAAFRPTSLINLHKPSRETNVLS